MDIFSRSVTAIVVAGLIATACGSDGPSDPGATEVDRAVRVPLIVDYSPTLSDVPALMYLATHQGFDLRAVTLVGTGESECGPGVRNTLSLLRLTGHDDVPVACGPTEPLAGDREWPAEFIAASSTIEGVLLPGVTGDIDTGDAVAVLIDVLEASDEPVLVITLGPLTNLAVLLDERPDLVDAVDHVVTMGGAVDAPGNVPADSTTEWNLYIDPEANRRVLASGVDLVLVPLDATNLVPGNAGLHERLARAPELEPGGDAVRQLYAANLEVISSDGWYFWDELAAVVATDEAVATLEPMTLVMDESGGTRPDPAGTTVQVATAADPVRFAELFVGVLSGGREESPMPFGSSELAYLDHVASSGERLAERLEVAFAALFSLEGVARMGEVGDAPVAALEDVFGAYGGFAADLLAAEVPDIFAARHTEMLRSLDVFLALREGSVGGVRDILDADPDQTAEEFFAAFDAFVADIDPLEPLAEVVDACDRIALEATLRGVMFADVCAAISG